MKTRAPLLALLLLAVTSCRDNGASVELQAICYPTDDCTFSATCTNTLMGEPAVDAGRTGALWLPIQVANQMPANADAAAGRLNTHDAHVDQFVIEYSAAGLGRVVLDTNQMIPAGGTTVLGIEVLPVSLGAQARLAAFSPNATPKELIATLRLRGYFTDGSRFETADYPIAVKVCTGCVGACPTTKVQSCPRSTAYLGQSPYGCSTPQ